MTSDSDTAEDGMSQSDACNVSGHEWTEWSRKPFGIHASSVGVPQDHLLVTYGIKRECEKCGRMQFDEKKVGTIKFDGEELIVQEVEDGLESHPFRSGDIQIPKLGIIEWLRNLPHRFFTGLNSCNGQERDTENSPGGEGR